MNWLLFKNSLLVSGATVLLAAFFGLVTAVWVAGLPRRWQAACLGLSLAALALPPFLVTNCWLHFLGHNGAWRGWLPLDIFSLGGTVWILSLLLWPLTLLALWGAWQRLEPAQLECDPAVRGGALFRALLLPLGRAGLVQAAVLTFVLALNNFAVPAILQVKVFPAEIWVRFNTSFNSAEALWLSWPLVVGPMLLILWLSRRSVPWPHWHAPVSPALFRRQLGRGWHGAAGIFSLLLLSASVVLPVYQLASASRTWAELPGALSAGSGAVWNSVLFAVVSATVVIGLSLVVWGMVRTGRATADQARTIAGWGLWLPFLLPGVLLGIGLILVFNRPWLSGLYQSAGIVILALAVRYLAVGWNGVAHAVHSTDRDLRDVALVNGAGRWQVLRHAYWPQIGPQAMAAWYVVFLLCLWDVESMVLIVPPGGETVALRVFNLLHYGHNAQVNALCLVLLGLAVAPLLGWQAARFWRTRGLRPVLLPVVMLGVTGCGSELPPNAAALSSRFFSQAQVISTRGAGVGQVNKPRSLAVDRGDNVFVVDMTGRVQKFSATGQFLLQWQMPETALGRAKGMCRDRQGNIVVIEPHYSRVNHYAPDGTLVLQWGDPGSKPGQLGAPRAVAVTKNDEIMVSEYSATERVQRFRLREADAGKRTVEFVNAFGRMGTGPGEFNRPEGLCVDAQDRVYVADSCNHRIQVFSPDGRFLRSYGRAGSGLGELSYPYDICVDAAGRQYVCEFGNSRIQVFDGEGRPLEIIGGPGAEPGRFSNPWGVALDSRENLYVADSQNHRVQKLVRRQAYAQAGGGGAERGEAL